MITLLYVLFGFLGFLSGFLFVTFLITVLEWLIDKGWVKDGDGA
jgi:hypothetical protein